MNLTSTTRLPLDHMISGALIGAIAAGGVGILNYKKGSASKAEVVAKTTKTAIQGGIVTACAISASNKLVSARYFAAAVTVAVGIAGVVATENLIKNLEESK
ncbi:Cys/Met metabolism pyridoxal-phosphate-dependent enzyme [uncultured Campylobacter sp.]|uniref:Cys/Met metabolism pyridoxal-phosphate-dependent enzyme n=1 Tax=uncultured Campylobacter sp. TaxID=218934 RepID=UPI002615EBCF|nr:Cys/Met metabolism pyridoxal-phosphate-dependent enzyme [uncultured Campylobacter sp.]